VDCRDHDHPRLAASISRERLAEEFLELARRAGLGRCALDFSERMRRVHEKRARRYAEVEPERLRFYLAPQALWLPREHRRGLLAHEIGHVLAPRGDEDDADRAAADVLGVEIEYDLRWPGKGLQVVG
jgi:hypothetical protein